MSSWIIIQQREAVHLVTDGAYYDGDGVVRGIQPKVRELPSANCIYVTRGTSRLDAWIAAGLGIYSSFDEITAHLPMVMEGVVGMREWMASGMIDEDHQHFEITVAGWSDELKSWAAGIASTFAPLDPKDPVGISHMPGYERYVPFYAAPLSCCPPIYPVATLGRKILSQKDVDALDPVKDGLAIHVAQRQTPGVTANGCVQYLVGGLAELVTVSSAGIKRQILREWPDAIGCLLQPDGAEPIEDVRARVEAMAA